MKLFKLVFMTVFLLLLSAGCFSKPSVSGDAVNSQDSDAKTMIVQRESDESESSSLDTDDIEEDSALEEDLAAESEEILEDDLEEILEEDEILDEGIDEEVASNEQVSDIVDDGLESVVEEEDNIESDATDAALPDDNIQSLSSMDSSSSSPLEEIAIYFGFDRYNLTDKMLERVKEAAVEFMDNEQDLTLKIEGNADERGHDEYNYALALRRAQSVKNALVNYGLNPSKINLVSYGESNPVCEEQAKACYSKNRRVNFKILP